MATTLVAGTPETPTDPAPVTAFVVERPYLIQDGRKPTNDVKVSDTSVELESVGMSGNITSKVHKVNKAFGQSTR